MLSNIIQHRSFWLRQMVPLLVCWFCSFYMLITWTIAHNITPTSANNQFIELETIDKNTFREVYLTCINRKNRYRPEYAIRFQEAKLANGKIGVFHSALCKQVQLQDVSLHVYSHSDNTRKARYAPKDFESAMDNLLQSLPSRLIQEADINQRSALLDALLDNTGICITDFHFDWLHDNESQLTIKSKQAHLTALQSGQLVLRGAVKIQTHETTIQSNHIIWDLSQQLFTVKGSYCLTQPDGKHFGRDICFDDQLNIQQTPYAISKLDGEARCLITNMD